MARATKAKRLRAIDRVIAKATGSKRARFLNKRAFVETLLPGVSFDKGAKIHGEGGYR
jgi:hypothetical protein